MCRAKLLGPEVYELPLLPDSERRSSTAEAEGARSTGPTRAWLSGLLLLSGGRCASLVPAKLLGAEVADYPQLPCGERGTGLV